VTPCSIVVGYQSFRGPCCLHPQVVTPCNAVVGCQRFKEPYCLHPQVVTPCSIVVGYQRFGLVGYCMGKAVTNLGWCYFRHFGELNVHLFFPSHSDSRPSTHSTNLINIKLRNAATKSHRKLPPLNNFYTASRRPNTSTHKLIKINMHRILLEW
jgi:hypothetical protein